MLLELHVRNLALIEDETVVFGRGLNVVTGSTGAGKSLLLAALSLLIGGRFNRELLRTGADHLSVEGILDVAGPTVARRLRELTASEADDLPTEMVVSRRIDASGRNRCRIDGATVPVSALKQLGGLLVEMHGQSEHQALLAPGVQSGLLDQAAGLVADRESFSRTLTEWRAATERLESVRSGARERFLRIETLESVTEEIRGTAPVVGEREALRRERTLLADGVRHAESIALAASLLSGDDRSADDLLGRAARELESTAELSQTVRSAQEAIDEALVRLDDASRLLDTARHEIRTDPERLEEMQQRLEDLDHVLRRHGPTEQDALDAADSAEEELSRLRTDESDSGALESRVASLAQMVEELGLALNTARRTAAKPFGRSVVTALGELGMAETRFEVRVDDGEGDLAARATSRGLGTVRFTASPNPGEDLRPLSRIASGGELARLALAIKGELAGADDIAVVVFDEIDADVGPRMGEVIGRRLAALAQTRQVLVVTHLAQVASFAQTHLKVEKETSGGRTFAKVVSLEGEARELEIAEMILGQGRGADALEQARGMLRNRTS